MASNSKERSKKTKQSRQVVAHVYLRPASGKSIRELADGPLPIDLSLYLPPASARDQVIRHFEQIGFQVLHEANGLTLSIHGPASLFAKTFGVSTAAISNPPPTKTIELPPAPDIQAWVDQIVVAPPPEMHL